MAKNTQNSDQQMRVGQTAENSQQNSQQKGKQKNKKNNTSTQDCR